MFKKNTRKRLLAGALATVMMLTMCPTTWALADDEDIATPLPLVDENRPVVDSAPVEADPTETPAVPTPSETENQNTAPAPSDDGANGGTDSTEAGNSTNSTIPEGSGNNSQNNDAVSNAPENEIASQDAPSHDAEVAPAYLLSDVTKTAECWVTNRHAADSDGNWKTTITNAVGDGADVTTLAAPTIEAGNETYVFWQARVLPIGQHQSNILNGDRTKDGTEIDRIRYVEATWTSDYFEYREKDTDSWKKFKTSDQLVFYYLVRTDYSEMVQIDVSDWTVNEEPSYDDRRSVTYQVYVKGGNEDGTDKLAASRKFWYNKTFTVSSVLVREADANHYTIDRVELDPDNLGAPTKNENGEYQFSLYLSNADTDNATVKIYVTPKVQPVQLAYELNGGKITSTEGTYTPEGLVYPDAPVTTPEVAKDNCTFGGWYTDAEFKHQWEGNTMPNEDLTLHAQWIDNNTTVDPETTTPAKYFVLLPNLGTPQSGASQGWTSYLPNVKSDGGVKGLTRETGYKGFLKPEGKRMADEHRTGDDSNGIYNVNGFGDDYLVPPTDLGFFDENNWSSDGKRYKSDKESNTTDPFSVLGTNFNVKNNIRVVWYTIKYQADEGKYHVDGYVAGVPVNVTYHSNFGTDVTEARPAETGKVYDTVSYDTLTTLPSRPNFEFTGWYTDKACKERYTQQCLKTSLDLYAGWNQTAFDVSYFYKDDQNVETQFGTTETYKVGDDVTVKTAHPEKEGYTFKSWTNIAKIVTVDANGNFKMPAKNVRFDATFKINQYNVTYKVDGKEVGTDVYDFNSDVVIRDVPTKEGYTFSGWKIGTADAENFKMPAHDVTIEGTFAKNSSGGHHHRRPTVTIPDEVPTGLNGNDHYAYIVGYPDKTVRPQNGITRAEVATIFFRLLTDETRDANSTKSNSYSDVAAGAWYNHAVSTLSAMGIVKGDSDGKFNPNAPITRAEFAAIAARFDDKANTTTADFSDIASHWAKNEISAASNNGWITGYPDGTFRPDNKITRAEAMTLVNRVLKRLPETAEDLHDDMIKWSDNSDVSQWFYLDVQEATNSHYYQTKENQFEKWTELRDTRDWTELEK